MTHVLIVEDEALLRTNLARGIAKMEGVTVSDAGSVDEALASIAAVPPDLVLSDIDMPERSGIELLDELAQRGLSVPVIFVSAYLKAYRSQIPEHPNIGLVEKPVALSELRRLIRERLAASDGGEPFTVPDYLQLASMGRRSVVIEVVWPDGTDGEVVVNRGEAWRARCGALDGPAAFAAVAWRPATEVRVRTVDGRLGERNLDGNVESLLMETARLHDESRRDAVDENTHAWSIAELAETSDEAVDDHGDREVSCRALVEDGVKAVLLKDYEAAVEVFRAALAIDPDHPIAKTNVERLRQLGHGHPIGDDDDETHYDR
ncbi:MAG: response regulator [Polyangiaceae bacterium]